MSFRSDLLSTSGVTIGIALGNVLVFGLAVRQLGDIGFAEYALGRRVLAVALPAAMIGIGVSLPRYIAMTNSPRHRNRLLVRAVVWLSLSNGAVWALGIAFRSQLAASLFGSSEATRLLMGVGIALAGGCAHAVAYGYLRGVLHILPANALNLIALGGVPVLAVTVANAGTSSVFVIQGISLLVLAGFVLVPVILTNARSFDELNEPVAPLISYGIRRVPGDLALMALLSAPSILAVALYGVEIAGMVAFGTTLVTLAGTALSPLSTLLLPYLASARGEPKTLAAYRRGSRTAVGWLVGSGVLFCSGFGLLSEQIVGAYLGASYASVAYIAAIMVWGGIGYGVHVALRSIVDAIEFRAVNSASALVALSLCVLWSAGVATANANVSALLVGFVAAVTALGAQTWWHARRVLASGQSSQ